MDKYQVLNRDGHYVRTYSIEQGENYHEKAIGFAKKIGGSVGSIIMPRTEPTVLILPDSVKAQLKELAILKAKEKKPESNEPLKTIKTMEIVPPKVEDTNVPATESSTTKTTPDTIEAASTPFCTQCDSKGVTHKKVCPTQANKE